MFIATGSAWLYPCSVQIPGWRHTWDLLTRRGLFNLPWVLLFVKQVKGLCNFVMEDLEVLRRDLESRGFLAWDSCFALYLCLHLHIGAGPP